MVFKLKYFIFNFLQTLWGIIPIQIMVAALYPLTKIIIICPNSSFFFNCYLFLLGQSLEARITFAIYVVV